MKLRLPEPTPLCPVSAVPDPGSFRTHDASGLPLLVTRDHGGKVHVMVNACRHRGTRLVFEKEGRAATFVCPQHNWIYDLCGRLGEGPVSRCSPTDVRDDSSLTEVAFVIEGGVIRTI